MLQAGILQDVASHELQNELQHAQQLRSELQKAYGFLKHMVQAGVLLNVTSHELQIVQKPGCELQKANGF